MTSLLLALLASTGCPQGETFIETDRDALPEGKLEVVRPKPPPPPRPGCSDGEMGRDCAFIDEDQRRWETERVRLASAPVVGVARAVERGVCVPASLRGALWLRTSAGHWWLRLVADERPGLPRKRGPRFELLHFAVRGVPANEALLVLPAAKVVPGDGGTLEFDVVGPVDTLALVGARASTFTIDESADGGVSTADLTVLPQQGPELQVLGAAGEVKATVHAWTAEAGAYDLELSTRRPVTVQRGRGRLPVLEPGAVSVVEASSGALVGAALADPSAAIVTITLGAPATLHLPGGHRVVEWNLVEDTGDAEEPPCQGTSQPWRTGRVTRGQPTTLRVPAGPRRCLLLQHETSDGTAVPWLVPAPGAGQTVHLPVGPPTEP